MSITTQAELITSLESWLHLSASHPYPLEDFITIAESKFNKRLRLRAQEDTVTGSVSASVSLPDDFLEVISVSITSGGVTYPIEYCHPSEITSEAGGTRKYTISGSSIIFEPVESGATYSLRYFAKFPALADGSNWLIENSPETYLYGALVEAAPYRVDDARIPTWAAYLEASLATLERQDRDSRCGNTLRMKAR